MSSTGAQAVIRDGKIEISIDIDALPIIMSGSCCSDGVDGLWRVTEPGVFAKEVCRSLNDEREDGTTRVHMMFDGAFMHAIEQGAGGVEEVSEEAFEAESARLSAEARGLGKIGPGHVCKHGVRWPHACHDCDDAVFGAGA